MGPSGECITPKHVRHTAIVLGWVPHARSFPQGRMASTSRALLAASVAVQACHMNSIYHASSLALSQHWHIGIAKLLLLTVLHCTGRCVAFSYDGSCGTLKTATGPTKMRCAATVHASCAAVPCICLALAISADAAHPMRQMHTAVGYSDQWSLQLFVASAPPRG
jgi:hypothetical protein